MVVGRKGVETAGGASARRPEQVALDATVEPVRRTDPGHDHVRWFAATAARLWPAWKGLNRWEETIADELPELLGDLILLLWSVHRLGEGSVGGALLDAAVDEDLRPTMSDPVLDDIVQLAFALGAAWAEDRGVLDAARDERPMPPLQLRAQPAPVD
jgi:hypothetical protein